MANAYPRTETAFTLALPWLASDAWRERYTTIPLTQKSSAAL